MIELLFIAILFLGCYFIHKLSSISIKYMPPEISRSCLNPGFFVAAILIVFLLDFATLFFSDLSFQLYEEKFLLHQVDVFYGTLYFVVCLGFILLGFIRGSTRDGRFSRWLALRVQSVLDLKVSRFVFFSNVVLVIGLIVTGPSMFGTFVTGELTRQVFFAENKLAYVAFISIMPSYAFYASSLRQFGKSLLIPLLISLLICLISGSRGWVIYIGIISAFAYRDTLKKYGAQWYLVACIFVFAFLLLSRYYLREAWRHDSIFDFIDDSGGLFNVFFNTSEVSMAEVISILVKHGEYVTRSPHEWLTSFLMYPLPRNLFEFKPLGIDAYVTSIFSPDRWYWTKSEITVTLFGDLFLHFGYLFSFLVLYLCAREIMRLFLVGAANEGISPIIIPLAMWIFYVSVRSSAFNAAAPIWSFLIVLFLNIIFVSFSIRKKESDGPLK